MSNVAVVKDIILIDPATGICDVTHGPARNLIRAHIHHVALAYLNESYGGEAASLHSNITWQDHLIAHGIAIAAQGNNIMTLAIIPSRLRTIDDRGTNVNIAFPPILMALKSRNGRYATAQIYLINPAAVPRATVAGTDNVLMGFPYGNVYDEGNICWGTVGFSQIDTIAKLQDTFFNTQFNHDLWRGGDHGFAHFAAHAAGVIPPPTAGYHLSINAAARRLEGAE